MCTSPARMHIYSFGYISIAAEPENIQHTEIDFLLKKILSRLQMYFYILVNEYLLRVLYIHAISDAFKLMIGYQNFPILEFLIMLLLNGFHDFY